MIFHLYFICLFVLEGWKGGWEKLRAPNHKAAFIYRETEVEKYPREESSYDYISKRDSYRSKCDAYNSWAEDGGEGGSSQASAFDSTEAVNMRTEHT